jgi:uncharacterized protein YegP (UPF0339 family)
MRYVILKSIKNGEFFWNFKADNYQPIMTSSETYVSKQGAQNSIAISKLCAKQANFRVHTASNGQYYFLQKANNGEDIGKSETYVSIYDCQRAIDLIIQHAPGAQVIDATN